MLLNLPSDLLSLFQFSELQQFAKRSGSLLTLMDYHCKRDLSNPSYSLHSLHTSLCFDCFQYFSLINVVALHSFPKCVSFPFFCHGLLETFFYKSFKKIAGFFFVCFIFMWWKFVSFKYVSFPSFYFKLPATWIPVFWMAVFQ